MASRSGSAERLITAWYGSIWLVLLGAIAYLLVRRHTLESPPLAILLGVFIVFSILAPRSATRLFACLAFTTLFVPFYLFEAYLRLIAAPDRGERNAMYVNELREGGLAAYPALSPSGFLALWQTAGDNSRSPIAVEGREILPIAGIPDVLTVYCHKADGGWVTYRSDALGFRTPKIEGRGAAPEFALLGDSFVQGYCVSDPFTYAEQLSILGPTANYGMNATSALAQLAIYREYVKDLRYHHIIWFFFEGNDLQDYLSERTWPLLRAYLERGHFQNLVRLNDPISSAMKYFVDKQLGSTAVANFVESRSILGAIVQFLLLRQARTVLRLAREPLPPDLSAVEWREITGIWRQVVETQRMQSGQVTFVYIPTHYRFLAKDSAPFQALERKVVRLWSGLGADYVTLTQPLQAAANPLIYYADDDLHFNEEGYRLTAETIVEHLRRSAGG